MGTAVFMPLTQVPALLDGSEHGSADLGQPRQTLLLKVEQVALYTSSYIN